MDTSQAEVQQLYNRLDDVIGKPDSDKLMNLLTHSGASQESVDVLGEEVNRRFEEMSRRFEEMGRRFEDINGRFEEMGRRFEDINRGFEAIHDRFDRLYSALIIAGASAFVGFVGAMVTIVLRT